MAASSEAVTTDRVLRSEQSYFADIAITFWKGVFSLRKYRLFVMAFLLLVLGASGAWAAPASPFPVITQQPDGAQITLFNRGDEFCHLIENPEGYSLAKNVETG